MDDLTTQLMQELQELKRRVANMCRMYAVHSVDYEKALARVTAGGDWVSNWLHWTTSRASNDVTWWSPEVGEQVMVFSPNGETEKGVIIQATYQTAHPAPAATPDISYIRYKDGTELLYNRADHVLRANVKGDVVAQVTGNMMATVEENIDWT